MRKSFSIHYKDMYDKDVFINTRIFYARCGFKFIGVNRMNADLIVVLRGSNLSFEYYSGQIHIYDYVKNDNDYHSILDMSDQKVKIVSLNFCDIITNHFQVAAYLPVIPDFWQKLVFLKKKKNLGITHIGSYKGLGDNIEKKLVDFIMKNSVKVYGYNWHKVGVLAKGISHFKANSTFNRSEFTLGIMYNYQRGKTLSSRAWHGPIHGCPLISHKSEAIHGLVNIPGLIYVDDLANIDAQNLVLKEPEELRREATMYWEKQNAQLAQDLGLTLNKGSALLELWMFSYELIYKHYLKKMREKMPSTIRQIKKYLT